MATTENGNYRERQTPGVYVTELDAFPLSVVGVATAVPIFIGYTQIAADPGTGAPLYNHPVAITSAADYASYFGGEAPVPGFTLWQQIQLFYANGGGDAYIVSAGSYWTGQLPVTVPATVPGDWAPGVVAASALLAGLDAAGQQRGPTMIAIPEACQLSEADYATVVQAMLTQAGTLGDRMAILDLPDCLTSRDYPALVAAQASLWAAIGPANAYLGYGAAYAPALLLPDETTAVAPSGAIAGIWSRNDAERGVWNAPANIAVAGVSDPAYKMNDDQQEDFSLPVNGMAIDIIRRRFDLGTVVWGARTLDGNSQDFRYVQVRRTVIYIEQSITSALGQFAFAANDAPTWVAAIATVSNFLTGVWSAGGLIGETASDAFTVQCGVGSTMTGQDVLNGYMIVSVTLQMIRPAEFIVLTFKQRMEGS